MKAPTLVLASTSVYRRELLQRLGMPFLVTAPDVDETPLPGEAPDATARRLAEAKARAGGTRFPDALVIGSDQVAALDEAPLGKPLDFENAVAQLRRMRGRTVVFHTALALLNGATGRIQRASVPSAVAFRPLDDSQIHAYVTREQPFRCAGSAKIEALGIALLEGIESSDPTAIIGLPLIALVKMLGNEGVDVLRLPVG